MYGDRFGKSLCHAWGASPVYLLARYFVGVEITNAGKGEYELHSHMEFFQKLKCTLPVRKWQLHVDWDGSRLQTGLVEYNRE